MLAEEKRFTSAHVALEMEQQAEASRAELNTTNSLSALRFRFEGALKKRSSYVKLYHTRGKQGEARK